MRAYNGALEGTSNLVSHVDSTRNKLSTLCTAETRERIDCELQRTRLALESAKKAMGWKGETHSGVLATVDAVEWAFKHKEAAKAHNVLLRQCHENLLCICIELALVNERRPRPSETYFREVQTRMLAALSRRVERNSIIYSGVGEQAPRRRLFEPERQK
ncbi:hypothetical protein FGG08_005651 [Glutinoglossum americanum]|uniref:Uncharacterized protein n=1 Tax=Glutinoglossum americanum TaxID=1670608 RepID=A0A9P8KYA3_9PEZI|nr:hypothetical protein FGG08_005651 [Glutinoglossum americanum]